MAHDLKQGRVHGRGVTNLLTGRLIEPRQLDGGVGQTHSKTEFNFKSLFTPASDCGA